MTDETPPQEFPEDEQARVHADLERIGRGSFVILDLPGPRAQEEIAQRILTDDRNRGRLVIKDLDPETTADDGPS